MSDTSPATPPPKLHDLADLTNLSVVYLRNAVNNPKWSNGISDFIAGAAVLSKLPEIRVPKEFSHDNDILDWGQAPVSPVKLSDTERDAARTAFRHALQEKAVPINAHTLTIIRALNLE